MEMGQGPAKHLDSTIAVDDAGIMPSRLSLLQRLPAGARRLAMGLDDLIKTKRVEILRIAAEHGARNVRVFGSLARGDAGPESDLDLLVQMEEGRSLLDLVGLWQDLEELLGRRVDVVSEGGLSPYLRSRVLAEAVPL